MTHKIVSEVTYNVLSGMLLYCTWLAVWLSGNALASINVVVLHLTRLVLGWVTVYTGKPSRYVISQLGRLSLLPSVGR